MHKSLLGSPDKSSKHWQYHKRLGCPLNRLWSIHLLPFLTLIILLIWSNALPAFEVQGLYQGSVAVPDQSRKSRSMAQQQTLAKVLIKVTGRTQTLEHPAIKTALRQAGRYLRRFQFDRDEQGQWLYVADFDESKLNQLLRQQGLPIWGKRRPKILLWIAGEQRQNLSRYVIHDENYPEIRQQILTISQERGLPILLPNAEQIAESAVSVSDVWGYFGHYLYQQSTVYQQDQMVIARFRQHSGDDDPYFVQEKLPINLQQSQLLADQWRLQWRLYKQDQYIQMNHLDGTLEQVIDQLVHGIADHYAQQYAVSAANLANAPTMFLTVHGVGELPQLIAAERLLASFSAVAMVNLHAMQSDKAIFNITLVGESLDLLRGLALERQFTAMEDPLNPDDNLNTEFRWVP